MFFFHITLSCIITERDLVGIDAQTSRLIFIVSEADLVSENETDPTILLSKSVCKQFPEINVESDLLDAHLYVFKKWVCDYVKENEYANYSAFCNACILI
jgi:translation initiation factor eIF-2B subunit gamma